VLGLARDKFLESQELLIESTTRGSLFADTRFLRSAVKYQIETLGLLTIPVSPCFVTDCIWVMHQDKSLGNPSGRFQMEICEALQVLYEGAFALAQLPAYAAVGRASFRNCRGRTLRAERPLS